jgi:hypothetical protein
MDTLNPDTCSVADLLAAFRRVGGKIMAPARQLLVWGDRSETTDRLAAAIERRQTDVVAHLDAAGISSPDVVGEEPEIAFGHLPLTVAKAIVIGWVYDALDTIEGEQDWDRQIAQRDDSPPTLPTPVLTPRREMHVAKPRAFEFRAGKVVQR